ncbi:MAG: hypothetical protein ACYCQJ_12770 [Nitrososphaerales archaeon]
MVEEIRRKMKVQGITRGPSSELLNVNVEVEFAQEGAKEIRRYGCNLIFSKQDAKALNLQIDDELEFSVKSK